MNKLSTHLLSGQLSGFRCQLNAAAGVDEKCFYRLDKLINQPVQEIRELDRTLVRVTRFVSGSIKIELNQENEKN